MTWVDEARDGLDTAWFRFPNGYRTIRAVSDAP